MHDPRIYGCHATEPLSWILALGGGWRGQGVQSGRFGRPHVVSVLCGLRLSGRKQIISWGGTGKTPMFIRVVSRVISVINNPLSGVCQVTSNFWKDHL